jgi:hypothetical protein
MFLASGIASADTVRLKNGNVVEGKVIERTADMVKMDIGGVTLTYYADEIDTVADSSPATPAVAAVPEPAVAAPVAPVQPSSSGNAGGDELAVMNKDQLIQKFVQIYGVKENMQANFDQMTAGLKPEQAQAFREAVKVDDIVAQLLPVYDKHFSAEELRVYIRFYSSSEGRKLIQALPLLMKDSVDVSMKYLDAHLPASLKQGDAPAAGM